MVTLVSPVRPGRDPSTDNAPCLQVILSKSEAKEKKKDKSEAVKYLGPSPCILKGSLFPGRVSPVLYA